MADSSQRPQTGHVGELEITARDPQKIKAFLESVFGWKVIDHSGDLMTISRAEAGIDGHILRWTGDEPSYVAFYVKVDDIQATVERVVKAGGKVIVPESDIPGGGRFALFVDPENHLMGVYTGT